MPDKIWVLLGPDGDDNTSVFCGLFSTPEKEFEYAQKRREDSMKWHKENDMLRYPYSSDTWHLHLPYTLEQYPDPDSGEIVRCEVMAHGMNNVTNYPLYEITLVAVDAEGA